MLTQSDDYLWIQISSSTDMPILFDNKEHKLKLRKLNEEEDDKRKKIILITKSTR